jgi:hypothetical protein
MRDGLLLCELHAHTTWSDGQLTLPELVDLYGRSGFDVLAVTDHAVGLDELIASHPYSDADATPLRSTRRIPWRPATPTGPSTSPRGRRDREPAAVIAHLRSRGRFFLIPFALERRPGLPIAA